jgi:hypothetical protein
MVELLSGRLRNIAVDCSVCGSLFCVIGLHDLTGNFLLTAEKRRRCPVLAIDYRKEAAFYWRDNDGGELRPVEILGDLIDVGCAPPADFTLIRDVNDKFVGLDPFQKGCGSGRKLGCRRTEPLRAKGNEHCVLHL